MLISKTDQENENCPRQYSVLVRNGWAERFWMDFRNGELHIVDRPEPKYVPAVKKHPAFGLVKLNVFAHYKKGDRILYWEGAGGVENHVLRLTKFAAAEGLIEARDGGYWMGERAGAPSVRTPIMDHLRPVVLLDSSTGAHGVSVSRTVY